RPRPRRNLLPPYVHVRASGKAVQWNGQLAEAAEIKMQDFCIELGQDRGEQRLIALRQGEAIVGDKGEAPVMLEAERADCGILERERAAGLHRIDEKAQYPHQVTSRRRPASSAGTTG